MKKHRVRGGVVMAGLLLLLVSGIGLRAFPPAPYYTLFGLVRDQVGQVVSAEGATLVLLKDNAEVARTPINSTLQLDQNYELKMRIDANRSGTAIYSEKAIAANGLFSLVVEMNGSLFYPIEASGSLTAGKGGERVRLDLNLGEDLDGDGLPDIWEQWQLYQGGHNPDENGNWPIHLIDRNGDLDGDGQSNWLEYLAGTFADDVSDNFFIKIKRKTEAHVAFEFYAITGKTYTIESTTGDGKWTRVPFATVETAARTNAHTADTVGIVPAYCDPTTNRAEIFRMTVR